jgi:hypothetical protein
MKASFGRRVIGASVAVGMLAGCGGSQNLTYGAPPGDSPTVASGHKTFKYSGSIQLFTVPSGVTQVRVIALGGNGGSGRGGGDRGGYGGRVSAILPVTPRERLVVVVGGDASAGKGGYNGGGDGGDNFYEAYGGGGESDVRGQDGNLSSRIFVAGGGGGAGAESAYGHATVDGGAGGGLTGGIGSKGGYAVDGSGGGGGTQNAGGAGGSGGKGGGEPGRPGAFGKGGRGGEGCNAACSYRGGGGGGGGGYYGGGGGGAGGGSASHGGSGGGGGGGSSYVEPSATNIHMWSGWKGTKNGLVVFDW